MDISLTSMENASSLHEWLTDRTMVREEEKNQKKRKREKEKESTFLVSSFIFGAFGV